MRERVPVPRSVDPADDVVEPTPVVPVLVVELAVWEVSVDVLDVVFEAVVDVDDGLDDDGDDDVGIEEDGLDEVGVEEDAEVVDPGPVVADVDEVPVVLDAEGLVVDELAEVDGDEPVVDVVPVAVVLLAVLSAAPAPVMGVDAADDLRLLTSWQLASMRIPVQVVAPAGDAEVAELWVCDVEVPLCDCAWGAPQAMNAETIPTVRVFIRSPRRSVYCG